jgi:hypothetical protein
VLSCRRRSNEASVCRSCPNRLGIVGRPHSGPQEYVEREKRAKIIAAEGEALAAGELAHASDVMIPHNGEVTAHEPISTS